MRAACLQAQHYIISPVLSAALGSCLNRVEPPVRACCQRRTDLLPCSPCRGARTPLSLSGSTFTREDADLLTPDQEPRRSVGAETHAVMGKEVKEEQNPLKGCVVRSLGV